MIKFWPRYQSLELNKQVAYLFSHTRQKFLGNLLNKTNENLYIDLLDNNNKKQLFSIVLLELEILILDIVELDLNINNIKLLNYKILYDFIQKSLNRFLSKTVSYNITLKEFNSVYIHIVFAEHRLLLEYVLIYLIYGTSDISNNIFVFDDKNTPVKHVSVLFENLVIQVSDLVVCSILESLGSLYSIATFIKGCYLSNSSYFPVRSIALFRNTLIFQNFIRLYFGQPKAIYSSRYKVWLMSSSGLISKYIYTSRLDDLSTLSTIQLVILYLIELQDIIIPQIEKFLLMLSKIFMYILINLLGNSAILCIRSVIVSINNVQK
uniref:hypothetical protein n=1 Tax=Catenella fusiformis TaxID=3024791 RepID=UPI0027DAAF82|nr:hypothetical protein REQ04_pgp186 [Catenella fusiformis]WCH57441.1 hypothetical protein [Catenella fusiformis]